MSKGERASKRTIYEGLSVIERIDLPIDELYKKGKLPLKVLGDLTDFHPNENLVLKAGQSAGALAVVKGKYAVKLKDKGKEQALGIYPHNKEQAFAMNLLMDPKIKAVTLTGAAGTGKSLLAVSAGLEQCFGKGCRYRKMIYIKSLIPVGKELGFLPGDLADKADPFMDALRDCLAVCRKQGKDLPGLIGWEDNSKIQKMPASFVRGRTFRRCYVVVDEAQNFSTHELKTILTRLDDESKAVVIGDIDQVDTKLSIENDGLYQVVEKFKDEEMFGHINLIKSERSKLAQLVADKL